MEWRFDVTKELEWPARLEQPLIDTLHWVATFESYDPAKRCCRYQLWVADGDKPIAHTPAAELVLSRAPLASGDDPELLRELRTRLDHFAVRLAIAHVDRYDWLIRLAFSAATDHTEALYRGLLYSKPEGRFVTVRKLLWPKVTPRELVYAKLDMIDAEDEWVHARVSGIFLGIVPASVTYQLVFAPTEYEAQLVSALIAGFSFVTRRLILWYRGRTIRNQSKSLSDADALLIVLADLKVAIEYEAEHPRHERLRQSSLKALRGHLLASFPETPTVEEIQLDRIGAQLER